MYFDNIIGHDRSKQFILNSMKKDRISHAYLFEGPSGIGKMILIKLSPCELRINNAGIDISKGINSLIIPTKIKRFLLNFPVSRRQTSTKKISLKKINPKYNGKPK